MRVRCLVFGIVCLHLAACTAQQQGTLEGSVSPTGTTARITAQHGGSPPVSADADLRSGAFRMVLPPGTYDVTVVSPASPFPLKFSGISVNRGRTTTMAPIVLGAASRGIGSIFGTVRTSSSAATRVRLLEGGTERAATTANAQGRFEFERVTPGPYTLTFDAPGYANDRAQVGVSDGQRAAVNIRMLYASLLDGVNWDTGSLRVRGIGLPPSQAATPTVRRELAKRAALADAERNLLRVLSLVQVGPGEPLSRFLGEEKTVQRLQGFVQGYTVSADRDLAGGRVEIELQLPLTGPGGLSSYLAGF